MKKIIYAIIIIVLIILVGCTPIKNNVQIIQCPQFGSTEKTEKYDSFCLKHLKTNTCQLLLGGLYDSTEVVCTSPIPQWNCISKSGGDSFYSFSENELNQCLIK